MRVAVEAEEAGIDTVMLSEHVVLAGNASSKGVMSNPRDYAAPGNQDPMTPWPDSMLLAAAIASATSKIRIALAAVIFPLRHPLLLAKQLATLDLITEGRLIVQPTVSWQEEEYVALGVPFRQRGMILDEQLEAISSAWKDTPSSFQGRFFRYRDVYVVPKPFRPDGLRMWFGGQKLHAALLKRIAKFGHGFHPFGSPTPEELASLKEVLSRSGRDVQDFEMVGGIRATFPDNRSVGNLAKACQSIPGQIAQGYNSICFKPGMYTDDPKTIGALCRDLVHYVRQLGT